MNYEVRLSPDGRVLATFEDRAEAERFARDRTRSDVEVAEATGEPVTISKKKPRAYANRNLWRRERYQAMRDLGLVKTPYGWE